MLENHLATQQSSKTVFDNSAQVNVSQAAFTYDLQGRLHTATITSFTAGSESRIERTTYDYDASGIRVSALHEIDTDANGTRDVTTRTEYLVDHRNFTGYQQVIKETVYDDQGNVVKTIEYNFGHDEISQTVTQFDAAGQVTAKHTEIFGHDGHGSVKVLYDAAAAILQVFTYEAYGQMLAIHNAIAAAVTTGALTSLQYSGEQFDNRIGQQYLRARYYDPNTGRFNRLDPFAGNSQDPQSFHKYLYAHGNPVMGVDPIGHAFVDSWSLQGVAAHVAFSSWAVAARPGSQPGVTLGTLFSGFEGFVEALLKPDLTDKSTKEIFELKPVRHKYKPLLQATDRSQMLLYEAALAEEGLSAGDSFDLVPYQIGGLSIGVISTGTTTWDLRLWPADRTMTGGLPGDGLVWYKLKKTTTRTPPKVPVPVTEVVRVYEGERIRIRTWDIRFAPIMELEFDVQPLVAATAAALTAGLMTAVARSMLVSSVARVPI